MNIVAPSCHIIGVIGSGAWGTTLAYVLALNGHTVVMWSFEQTVADIIQKNHINDYYIPEMILPDSVTATTDLLSVCKEASILIYASPTRFLSTIFESVPIELIRSKTWVLSSKGLEQVDGFHVVDLFFQSIPAHRDNVTVLSGPTFAVELCKKNKTVAMVAGFNNEVTHFVKQLFQNDFFKLYISDDVQGLVWCGVLKNIAALLWGMLEGIECSSNTRAFLFVRMIQEMALWVELIGGNKETVYSFGGLGDFYLTAHFGLSKNRLYGTYIAQGFTDEDIRKKIPTVPEGVMSMQSLYNRIADQKNQKKFPLLVGIYMVLQKRISLEEFIHSVW